MRSIFEFSLLSIWRYGYKHLLLAILFGLLVFIISSVLMITSALKKEYREISASFPELIIQKNSAGLVSLIDEKSVESLWREPSVSSLEGRVWGQYYFEEKGVYLTIIGIKNFIDYYNDEIRIIAETFKENEPFMVTSPEILDLFKDELEIYRGIIFFTPDLKMKKIGIGGVYRFNHALENADIMLLDEDLAREILGIEKPYFKDFVARVTNENEVENLAKNIRSKDPSLRVLSKDEMLKEYEMMYDYKSGWFLGLFLISVISFLIILHDKTSGLSSEEKKELALLRALGWEISDIIKFELTKALVLSNLAFLVGVVVAIFYVFNLDAPLLMGVFSGYSTLKPNFSLEFSLEVKEFVLIFLLTVPLYTAASIIPAWKSAVNDAGMELR